MGVLTDRPIAAALPAGPHDLSCHSVEHLLALGESLAAGERGAAQLDLVRYLAPRLLALRTRSGETRTLHLNAMQQAFEDRRTNANIILKARQMGMTTWIAGSLLLKTITKRGVLTVQVAHTREAAESIFGMVQRIWENLPGPWRAGALKPTRSTAGRMVFGALDSEFRVLSAGEENAGRGLTIQNLHLSEVARWPGDARATLAGLRAALAPGGELILESTPNGAYGAFYEEWQAAPETGLTRHFFPWWLEPAYAADPATHYTEEERDLAGRHRLSARQIGFRRTLERSFRGLRAQEYAEDPESCFKASGDCCLPVEAIDARLAAVPAPLEVRLDGALEIWFRPQPSREYIVGVDTAGGGPEGDFAAIQVIERITGLQCAELRARLDPYELARHSARLAREYGNALLAVERNNHGASVLALLDIRENYRHLYEQHSLPGWNTTSASKPAMIGQLGVLLEENSSLFYSRRLLAECRSFVSFAGGRMGAAAGHHDDCLIAMAIAQSVRLESLRRTRAT